MTDFLEYIGTWSVLKWIVLVLIAGFIGQFGKMTAEAIVKKVRARRTGKMPSQNDSQLPADATTPSAPESPMPALPSTKLEPAEKLDKKLIKAMAKAGKKEAKKNK